MSGVFCFFCSSILNHFIYRSIPMKFPKTPLTIAFVALLLLLSCKETGTNSGKKAGQTAGENKTTLSKGIHRYEKALFGIPQDRFRAGIHEIADEYAVFLGNNKPSPDAINQLQAFVTDKQNQEVYAECLKRFPDLSVLTADLEDAFVRIKNEIPDFMVPEVYTYVSGFDFQYPIKYTDSALIIALDMYLGSDYPGYPNLGIPLYISDRLTPQHILPDCIKEISMPLIRSNKSPVLLDAMIEEGKMLWFTDFMLPNTEDYLKIGFTKAQLKWCTDNENNIWSFLIENELLYSNDARSMSMFMTDGPFTASFSQDSPSRTGAWLGWQIVKAYGKNKKTSLIELLANTDSQEILEKSGYKPRKK
jgi:hypothetical protein